MTVQLSPDRQDRNEPEWWLPLALLGCLVAILACAAVALAL
jgi:hypothetical protein